MSVVWRIADKSAKQTHNLRVIVSGMLTGQTHKGVDAAAGAGSGGWGLKRHDGTRLPVGVTPVKGGVNLDHFGGAKVDQLVKG